MRKDRESIVAGAAVLGVSALLFTQVMPGQFEGVPLARNPMTVPRFLLSLFALGGVALLARGVLAARALPGMAGDVPPPDRAWAKVALTAGLACVYLMAFADAGFLPATVVFLPAVMLVLGYRNGLVIVATTVLSATVLWYLFAEGFSIRPPGIGFDDLWRALSRPEAP